MKGRASWLRAARLAGLPLVDVALATLLLVLAVPSALALPDEGPPGLTVPVALVMSGALAWRTRAPLAAMAAVVAAGQLQTLVAHEPGSVAAFGAYLVAAYSVARASSEGRAAIGGAALVAVQWLQEWQEGGTDFLFVAIVFGGAWLLGRLVQQWQSRATAAELNQDERARLAVAEERARIARELHDIVAHGVSVIAVQADAAEAVLGLDPERAREPLRVIRSSAREVLDEMRRLLVLLRMDGEDPSGPQPGLADLEDLVRSVDAAGLPVRLEVHGTVGELAPGVDLSAYRIVQEALTNVLKHAGRVPTSVVVAHRPELVVVEISNAAGPGSPLTQSGSALAAGGHGLVGVRERVMSVGGDLAVGPREDGGFVVRASLPRGASVRAPW